MEYAEPLRPADQLREVAEALRHVRRALPRTRVLDRAALELESIADQMEPKERAAA